MTISEIITKNITKMLSDVKKHNKKVLIGDDPEALHDLRVSIRKLRTVFRIIRKFYDPFYIDLIRNELNGFFEKTNIFRDLEVSLSIIKELPITKQNKEILMWYNKKRQEENNLRLGLVGYLKTNPLDKAFKYINALLTFPPKIKSHIPVEMLIMKRISKIEGRIIKIRNHLNIDKLDENPVLLHKMRIQCKRLRYSIEFFSPLLPASFNEKMKMMKKMQTALGNLNDLFVLTDLLHRDNELEEDSKIRLMEVIRERKEQCISEIRKFIENPLVTFY